ncbi:MAG: CoB--CoM heterodisulfide reductase iron-sulfur subunit A family protein [Cellulomonas sp.]|uniref:CoB--CoM heterodisulfide reductase iron-sulfur subunit A family protein n=1 Tax=Cellulomonas sp. 73-92 TaxID=1895740 RepID=UPI000927A939|nr:4Fe-4S binding protein [Cellulomonas sp. 73-92]MBN9375429.1 CoB--CoM heterodisulfide reductase iron-sulfur subunit A family protein [Cellulomonas sp.]OJV76656.1 MAG: 4Fe-4S ferredoxin [Cellulomonas sp. 73-92]
MSENPQAAGEQGEAPRRIGVYICHCGGNISDYVDVAAVRAAIADDPDVVVATTTMFACADGQQHEMVRDIREQHLDGLVVASCSPKLHTTTFRGVSRRADLNPYAYTQVNIREQDSWAHSDDREGATQKAIALVTAGIAKTRLSTPLEPLRVETVPATMVVGGGVTGLRTAIGLADIGIAVILVEREAQLGGWLGRLGPTFPHDVPGRDQVARLLAEIAERPTITVLTNAELVGKTGSFGNYTAKVHVRSEAADELRQFQVGTFVIATGADVYQPEVGELGYGIEGVVTLAEFGTLVDEAAGGTLAWHGRRVRSIAYVYCVGNRQPEGNAYCSKFCCAATVHASLKVSRLDPTVRQFHLHRDVRAYGRYELLYTQSRERGSVYLRYPDDAPPEVERTADGRLAVTLVDALTGPDPITLPVDLVVLVTGMVPRENEALTTLLKLPTGDDGFYNEIHPKLRPVETVVDGVMIAGTCQGPKPATEAVSGGLAAVTQSAGILKRGFAELDPLVATVNEAACTGCGACLTTCPYDAISSYVCDTGQKALVSAANCKGCGGCVPVCPDDAIDLLGYTSAQMLAAIDGLATTGVPA